MDTQRGRAPGQSHPGHCGHTERAGAGTESGLNCPAVMRMDNVRLTKVKRLEGKKSLALSVNAQDPHFQFFTFSVLIS